MLKLLTVVFLAIIVTAWGKRNPMINPGMFEGDMLGVDRYADRNAIALDSQRWPGGEVPYVIDPAANAMVPRSLKAGMDHIEARTCIRFKKRTHERDYVRVFSGQGCYSYWGRIGGQQDLSLGEGCLDMGTVVHELLHAIGFEHEHNRSDRDDYLDIFWANIQEDFSYAFDKLNPNDERLLTDFDFDSVMLYGSTSFGKAPGLKTMVAKDGSILPEVYDKSGLSANDIKRIKMLYEC